MKIGSTVSRNFATGEMFSYDFSGYTVGDKLSIKYQGNEWRGAYEIIFGEVAE